MIKYNNRIMEQEKSFHYTYSAKENQEIRDIRQKYLPHEETKLEELKRLDNLVQSAGIMESLCAGIVGATGMLAAYPIYQRFFAKAKEKHAPRILELTEKLTGK